MSNRMSAKMNNTGVTLVEVMVSMVILLVVFMGLIQASLLSINHNLRNAIRDEAVRVAAESMSRLRSFNYACGELNPTGGFLQLINGSYTGAYSNCGRTADLSADQLLAMNFPTRNFRNLSRTYRVAKDVQLIDANNKRLIVRVRWLYPDDDPTLPEDQWQQHEIYYTMRNPAP